MPAAPAASPGRPAPDSDRTLPLPLHREPRLHPQIRKLFAAFGMDGSRPHALAKLTPEELRSDATMAKSARASAQLYELLPKDDAADEEGQGRVEGVQRTEEKFVSRDGTERKLFVFRTGGAQGEVLPAVVYIHGGAMVVGETESEVHDQWCEGIARRGLVVVAVDFRNAWTEQGKNPFPKGLEDCVAAVKFLVAQRERLGVGKIVLQGESGGANLSLATALVAKREGWVGEIAGVFASCPYISGGYGWSEERKWAELPSLVQCDGYLLYSSGMAGMAHYYAGDENASNPLAWPYHAAQQDLEGLPPHVFVMDELDPLRDEGLALYRKMTAAGVKAVGKVNAGTVHASALILRGTLPEVHRDAIRDIAAFTLSL